MEVITQGNPSESELFKRLVTTDPDDLMPPPDSNLSLTAEEKDLIRRWIAEGAEWKEHWAFAPVKQPTIPKPAKANWAKNEIDHFTLTKMTEAKVAPSPEANREKLIRRLSFDLTGLARFPGFLPWFPFRCITTWNDLGGADQCFVPQRSLANL